MSEPRDMDPFEEQFASLVRRYTGVAARPIDSLAVARTALSSRGTQRWPWRLATGRRFAARPWAAAVAAALVVGVVALTLQRSSPDPLVGQPSSPASSLAGPSASTSVTIPDELRHAWERPYRVAPGPDQWQAGYLSFADGSLDFRPELAAAASRSAITVESFQRLVATARAETSECAVGDVGTYSWVVEGAGTVLMLTAIERDACYAREKALAGSWVRADLPGDQAAGPPETELTPGTHETTHFDPFGDAEGSGRLSYTVPAGWALKHDDTDVVVLHRVGQSTQDGRPTDVLVLLFAQPRVARDFVDGEPCSSFSEAPGIGRSVDDVVAAITARPGVTSEPAVPVTIGGYDGLLLDLNLAPSWTGGCQAPEGFIVGVPLLITGSATGPGVGLPPDMKVRLILLDLGDGRTVAIAIDYPGSTDDVAFDAAIAAATPIIESFDFHASEPPP
jgi:hypothetical protein